MLRWPTRAKAAIISLFQPLQDIDVYVEDENDEVFYRTLLRRVAEPEIKIARIVSLGNRAAVLRAAIAHDHAVRPALFIVDGDLQWIREAEQNLAFGVHRHNAYCVENLLICEAALVKLITEDAVMSEHDAIQALNFAQWVSSVERPLVELFAAYATAQELTPHLRTVSLGVGVMCSQGKLTPSALNPDKVAARIDEIISSIEQVVGEKRTNTTLKRMRKRIQSLTFPLDAVSGKDFLLPLVGFRLAHLGSKPSRRSLRVRLATNCSADKLTDLRTSIFATARR